MSLDFIFEKKFTIEDVEIKTSIKVIHQNNNWWLCKNGSTILVKCYTQTEEDINKLKSDGFEILVDGDKTYLIKGDIKLLVRFDMGKNNNVDGLTKYGSNEITDIMDEIVITFQTKFITDEEEEILWRDDTIDVNIIYDDTTKKFGYKIENGVISK